MTSHYTELAPAIERLCAGRSSFSPLDGLFVARADCCSEMSKSVYRPSLGVVVQGAKEASVGGRTFRYEAGQCLIASVDVPVSSRVMQASPSQPFLAMGLEIDPAVVADLARDQDDAAREPAVVSAFGTSDLDAGLVDPLMRLLALADHPRDVPVLAPLIQREIVWRLLCGRLGPLLRQLALANGRAASIGRATAWIRDHYAEPLRVADLAALANMSVPTFHRHFKSITAMTPVQFQKLVRLQQARQHLLSAESIASVGYTVGYESLSQFNREYRRLYGLPPGRDMAALREHLLR